MSYFLIYHLFTVSVSLSLFIILVVMANCLVALLRRCCGDNADSAVLSSLRPKKIIVLLISAALFVWIAAILIMRAFSSGEDPIYSGLLLRSLSNSSAVLLAAASLCILVYSASKNHAWIWFVWILGNFFSYILMLQVLALVYPGALNSGDHL